MLRAASSSSSSVASEALVATLHVAARQSGVALREEYLSPVNDEQLGIAFANMDRHQLHGAIVSSEGSFLANHALIVELAAKYRLPLLYPYRDYVELGGLIAYAPDLGELAQRLAYDVHQILSGTDPGNIPIYQPTKFELLVNLKTANTLSLTIPPSILARADEVIE